MKAAVLLEDACIAPEDTVRIIIDYKPNGSEFQARWNTSERTMLYGMLELCKERITANQVRQDMLSSIARGAAAAKDKIKAPTPAELAALKTGGLKS